MGASIVVYNNLVIEVRNLQKVLGGKTVLNIPDLTVGPREIVGIFGPEDSGGDVLLALLAGRMRPTLGSVRVAGLDPARQRADFARRTGILLHDDAVYKNLSVRGNLEFQAGLFGLPKTWIADVLDRAGLADQAAVKADDLPSGLRRRLAFARAILHRPNALILQELYDRCDEATISLFGDLLRRSAEAGAAVLLLASAPARLAPLCTRKYEILEGRILEMQEASGESGHPTFRLPVKTEDRVILINPADILYADAGEGRTILITAEGRLPAPYTLAELENKLSRSGFFRAHRSILVNLQHVKEVIPYTRNSFSIRLDDPAGTKIPLSKSAAAELKTFFGY